MIELESRLIKGNKIFWEIIENIKPIRKFEFKYINLISNPNELNLEDKGMENKLPGTKETVYRLMLRYPMRDVAIIKITNVQTNKEIIKDIIRSYQLVYSIEYNTQSFGIYGHQLSDLALRSFTIYEGGIMDVGVDS